MGNEETEGCVTYNEKIDYCLKALIKKNIKWIIYCDNATTDQTPQLLEKKAI